MRNKSKLTGIFTIILIGIFSMAASCNTSSSGNAISPYSGGDNGLVFTFQEMGGSTSDTNGLNEVWDGQTFPIEVLIENKGEFTVEAHDVELEILGIAPSDFTGIRFTEDNDDELEKVTESIPNGGETYVNFGDATYTNLEGTHYDANVWVEYTFPYETYINIPQVCYKADIKDNTICEVDSNKQAFSSGGPIQVGDVKERYAGQGKIRLEIPITNVGSGDAKAHDNDDFEGTRWDEVYFEIHDFDWSCASRGNPNIARINKGTNEAIIRCENRNLEGNTYTKAITLTLTYYYQGKISQMVRIKEDPQ